MKIFVKPFKIMLLLVLAGLYVGGCSAIKGERFWWDDQKREELPDSYMLPDWPAEAPVPSDPAPYVPKEVPVDEIERATKAQHELIQKGIPRAGVPDPETNRAKVPVAKWQGGSLEEESVDITENDGRVTVSEDTVQEMDGNVEVETESDTLELK